MRATHPAQAMIRLAGMQLALRRGIVTNETLACVPRFKAIWKISTRAFPV